MHKSTSRFMQSVPVSGRLQTQKTKKVHMAGKKKKMGPLIDGTVPKPDYKSVSRANRKHFKTGRILKVTEK